MSRQLSQSRSVTVPSEREELLEAMLVETSELKFTPKGDPDPRLIRLIEFLARQAAREFYEQEGKKQRSRGS